MKNTKKTALLTGAMLASTVAPTFVNASTMTSQDKVDWLVYTKKVEGRKINRNGDTDLALNSTMTRAEMVRMLVQYLENENSLYDYKVLTTKRFKDVSDNHWASNYINTLADRKIISGYPDGNFNPEQPITFGELATILVRLNKNFDMGKEVNFPVGYVGLAAEYGLLTDVKGVSVKESIDRKNAFVMFYNAMHDNASYPDVNSYGEFRVTFRDGNSNYSVKYIKPGAELREVTPVNPTRTNKRFVGWSTREGKKDYIISEYTRIYNATTLYAIYEDDGWYYDNEYDALGYALSYAKSLQYSSKYYNASTYKQNELDRAITKANDEYYRTNSDYSLREARNRLENAIKEIDSSYSRYYNNNYYSRYYNEYQRLDKTISDAENLQYTSKYYRATSWEQRELDDKLKEAKSERYTSNSDYRMRQARENLEQAIRRIDPSYVGRYYTTSLEDLRASITKAEKLKESDYTAATWKNFKTALDYAKKISDKPYNYTESETNTARVALDYSMGKLVKAEKPVEVKVNKDNLNFAISEFEGKDKALYTKETYNKAKEVYDKAVVVKKNDKATQTEVDKVTKDLQEAIKTLKTKEAQKEEENAQKVKEAKDKLQGTITTAEAKVEEVTKKMQEGTKYSDDAYNKLTRTLNVAKVLLKDSNDPEELKNINTDLTNSIEALKPEEAPVTPPEGNTDPKNPAPTDTTTGENTGEHTETNKPTPSNPVGIEETH